MQYKLMSVLAMAAVLLVQQPQQLSAAPCYPAIFVFGDSLSDTGNGVLSANPFFLRTAQPPYGETVPGNPDKRFSDGRLLVDFLATRVGLPLLKPSLDPTANFNTGVNYAVSGATADRASKYVTTKFILPLTPLSLDVQVTWHLALKASILGPQKPSADAFSNGLYVLEIGGNDYIGALTAAIPTPPATIISSFVPAVISKIRNATEVLYASGAKKFLYISITPLGCSPSLLSPNPTLPRDSNGCIIDFNAISDAHGAQLLALVNDLRSLHPDATFTLLDYNGAYTQVLTNSASLGFTNTLDACCGSASSPNRFNTLTFCSVTSNTATNTLCPNPNVFLNWDGIHFTHKFNTEIARLTFQTGAFLNPSNAFATCTP
ncbi:hypothetical protein L7F22_014206 [Adiantum nelumboides]|nr:hypothetical protein [Adiantum nelumboides]